MNYLSVCSGIEAASVAWHDFGWSPLGFSEIEKFPSEVLKHHYPSVMNYGDMTKYKEWDFGTNRLDLLVGGTPCQSFSVAGLRKGLEDPRGNLALTYVGILDKFRPKWFVWENVQGVLSSSGGRDFGSFLGALAELGYGFSYRVLDAQYFGVAQRRKRVFVVGHLGDWRPTAKVLFESESLSGNIKKGRKERKKTSIGIDNIVGALCARDYKGISADNAGEGKVIVETYGIPGNWIGRKPENGGNATTPMNNIAPCLTKTDVHGIAVGFNTNDRPDEMKFLNEQSNTLTTSQNSGIYKNMAVRRLTPIECERLQGFPDNYTNIKENCPDSPRYKAMGNSMAVPVMRWIGQRIQKVENER